MAVGHDPTNNIMADKRTSTYKRRTVFLKGRGLFPGRTRERKAVGINKMCVSFGRITSQRWHYALLADIGCCGKQGEFSKVMRLESVAKVSIDPLGKFYRHHSKVSPEVSKNKVFKLSLDVYQLYAALGPQPRLCFGPCSLPSPLG